MTDMIDKSAILAKYARNEVNAEEHAAFQEWLKTRPAEEVEALMDEYGEMIVRLDSPRTPASPALLKAIHQEINETPVRRMAIRKWGWAAAVAALLAGGTYLWKPATKQTPMVVQSTDIQPGTNGAILTLSDGSQVALDSIHSGTVNLQDGSVAKVSGNKLVYGNDGKVNTYNTMSTPNGRQFQLELPDGTKVWLNSASSIHYPTVFSGTERRVDITGEAYFEVTRDAERPFRINVNDKAEVEVLGTDFNVNAYDNESTINTTLLEGSVRVLQRGHKGLVMKPGQQAQMKPGGIKIIDDANIEKAVAWKDGLFNFNGAKLDEVMRQLERWYDINVIYEKGVPDIELAGKMTRGVSLQGLLIVLKELGVQCKLEGKTLTILSVNQP
jgi:ferric-dicitrate binding protein FerR (iron transport regulator)